MRNERQIILIWLLNLMMAASSSRASSSGASSSRAGSSRAGASGAGSDENSSKVRETNDKDFMVDENNVIVFDKYLSIDDMTDARYHKLLTEFSNAIHDDRANSDITILCIGDPHFKVNDSITSYIMCQRIIKLAKHIQPDIIVVLGDTLHTMDRINVEPLCMSTYFLHHLENIATLYLIIGNHDRPINTDYCSPYHPFPGLKFWRNTVVADMPKLVTFRDFAFVLAPYVEIGSLVKSFIEFIGPESWKYVDAVFSHQEYLESRHSGKVVGHGDVWELVWPQTYAGHIHGYQKVQENVTHVGTPRQTRCGEAKYKTVSVVFGKKRPQAKTAWREHRFNLNMPINITITMKCSELDNEWRPPEGKVKLKLIGTDEEWSLVQKRDIFKILKDLGVAIDHKRQETKKIPDIRIHRSEVRGFIEMVHDTLPPNSALIQVLNDIEERIRSHTNNTKSNNGNIIAGNEKNNGIVRYTT